MGPVYGWRATLTTHRPHARYGVGASRPILLLASPSPTLPAPLAQPRRLGDNSGMLTHLRPRRIVLRFLRGLALIGISVLALLVLVCVLVVVQGRRDETHRANAALVLGAAQWNGAPSPVLRARLDRALELYRRGIVNRVILTGGVGAGDRVSEAAAGREYMLSQGVSPDSLLMEDQGITTLESLRNAAQLTRANGIESVLLVSDSYHMLRSLKIAHDLGMDAAGAPIRSSPQGFSAEEAAHVLREAGAYLMYLFTRS